MWIYFIIQHRIKKTWVITLIVQFQKACNHVTTFYESSRRRKGAFTGKCKSQSNTELKSSQKNSTGSMRKIREHNRCLDTKGQRRYCMYTVCKYTAQVKSSTEGETRPKYTRKPTYKVKQEIIKRQLKLTLKP